MGVTNIHKVLVTRYITLLRIDEMVVRSKKLKRAVKKLFQTCAGAGPCSFYPSTPPPHVHPLALTTVIKNSEAISDEMPNCNTSAPPKNLCAICLDPLSYNTATSPGQAIFTAQCSHAFHFTCISSNVRHGGVTCPICRAQWTQLPRNLIAPFSLPANQTDPVLQILDDSIASFRVHRRSFIRTARYNDDDPIEPEHPVNHSRLDLTLISVPVTHSSPHTCLHQIPVSDICHLCGNSSHPHTNSSLSLLTASPHHFDPTGQSPYTNLSSNRTYLCVRLAHQPSTDMVLVISPSGSNLRLMKQYMALVVFSMRAIDRLAIVAYSSAAARVFPLRRMTSCGKRTALQVIDRLYYMGNAEPIEGLKKGVKILADRNHENLESCILHLSGGTTRSYHNFDMEVLIPIHRFHVGYGFGTLHGLVIHEFDNFLARVLGGALRDIQLRIDSRIVRLGELRGGEERRIPLNMIEAGHVCVEYSYVDNGEDECIRTGEIIVGLECKRERNEEMGAGGVIVDGRFSTTSRGWDYRDPYMARRWAKHLHGYRQ